MSEDEEDIAEFFCLNCELQWEGKPGPTLCPRCGHDYVKWINYNELKEKWEKEDV